MALSPRGVASALLAVCPFALAACSGGEDVAAPDRVSPIVTIVQPQEGDTVARGVGYLVRISDPDGEQVVCSSIRVTIGSSDFSTLFRAACQPPTGDVRIGEGQILLRCGNFVMVFSVADLAGNLGVGRAGFTVLPGSGDPPGCLERS